MQDLRLIGVQDDGGHLILVSRDGDRYRLPLDEALRAAARRDRPRLGQLQIQIDGGLRPRDVQALIRSGMPSAEVATRAGWTLEKLAKYEGPILAEREYIASLARATTTRSRSGSLPLGERVAERLAARDVSADTLDWDAWRKDGPDWMVTASFVAGGRDRVATWSYDVRARTLVPRDDEARWLTEDAPVSDPDAARKAVPVYDVEAEGGITSRRTRPSSTTVDLAASMRESSGARIRRSASLRPAAEAVVLPLLGDLAGDPHNAPEESHSAGTQSVDEAVSGGTPQGEHDRPSPSTGPPTAPEQVPDQTESSPDLGHSPPNDELLRDTRSSRRRHALRSARQQERLRQAWDVHVFGPPKGSDPDDLP